MTVQTMTPTSLRDPRRWAPLVGRGLFPMEWPLIVICAGMPFTFLLGIHWLVWILPVAVFGVQLAVQREPIVIPRSVLPLLLLVALDPGPDAAARSGSAYRSRSTGGSCSRRRCCAASGS